jgi:uncharacterized protein
MATPAARMSLDLLGGGPPGLGAPPPRLGPVRQLVLQPTPFCNMDCRYCYLPDRSDRRVMPPETAVRAVECVFESGLAHSEVEVRWHAGEPLVVGTEYYRDVIGRLRGVVPSGARLRHTLQTNGTLIDADWCRLFRDEGIEVGLSIDGPADLHDRNRRTRSGRPTHRATLRAADLLRAHGLPFSVIAVLTIDALDRADELYEFFAGLGPTQVGFNVEEAEGLNEKSSLDVPSAAERLRKFLERFFALSRDGRVRCREFEEMRGAILSGAGPRLNYMTVPGAILCVGRDGDVTGFSPELQGHLHPAYGSFTFGNVHRDSLAEMLQSPTFLRMYADIQLGVRACRSECGYFVLCGGGAPSNKLGENGSFGSTSTSYCTFRYKLTADVVLTGLESELGIKRGGE